MLCFVLAVDTDYYVSVGLSTFLKCPGVWSLSFYSVGVWMSLCLLLKTSTTLIVVTFSFWLVLIISLGFFGACFSETMCHWILFKDSSSPSITLKFYRHAFS